MRLPAVLFAILAFGSVFTEITEAQPAQNADAQIERLIAELQVEPIQRTRTIIANDLAAYGQRAVPALRRLLDSPNRLLPAYAMLALGEMRAEAAPAVPDLIRIGKDPENAYRLDALNALGRIGAVNPQVIPMLVGLVPDESSRAAEAASKSLCMMGETSLPHILKLLPQLPETRRAWFVDFLATQISESPEALDAMDAQLASTNQQLSESAAMAMTGTPHGCQHLLSRLDASEVRIRRIAVIALGSLEQEGHSYAPQLAIALEDDDASVRYLALKAIELVGAESDDIVARVFAKLDDKDADVRWLAVGMVGRTGKPKPETIKQVKAKLTDDEPIIRIAAAVALFRLTGSSESSLATLDSLRDDESSTVRRACQEAYRQMKIPEIETR